FCRGAATVRLDTADRKLDLSHAALASAVSPGKIATQGDLRQKVRKRPPFASLPCAYTSGCCLRVPLFACFLNPGYARAAMDSAVALAAPAPTVTPEPKPSRVVEIRPEESKLACTLADGREFALSRLVGSHLTLGDELVLPGSVDPAVPDTEIYISKPSLRRA